MKKPLAILALLVVVTATGHAQEKIRKSVFGANAGVSIPYNEFARHYFSYEAGFASPGPIIEAEYLYYGRFFGFSSGIGYSSLFFNEKAYRAEYNRTLGGYGINEVSAGNYQVLRILAGFTLKLPQMEHTEVMFLFHLGYALSVHPNLRVTNSELGVINSVDRTPGGNPLANAGFKVNYWLNERYGVSLNGSVTTTEPSFGDETGPDGSFTMLMNYTSVSVGFVMNFKTPSL